VFGSPCLGVLFVVGRWGGSCVGTTGVGAGGQVLETRLSIDNLKTARTLGKWVCVVKLRNVGVEKGVEGRHVGG